MLPDEIIGIIFGFLPFKISKHLFCGNVYIDNNIRETREKIKKEYEDLVIKISFTQLKLTLLTISPHIVHYLVGSKCVGASVNDESGHILDVFDRCNINYSFRENYVIKHVSCDIVPVTESMFKLCDTFYIPLFKKLNTLKSLHI